MNVIGPRPASRTVGRDAAECFYDSFHSALARVRSLVSLRVADRATTELLTCEVLLRSLGALAETDERTRDARLLQSIQAVVQEHEEASSRRTDA